MTGFIFCHLSSVHDGFGKVVLFNMLLISQAPVSHYLTAVRNSLKFAIYRALFIINTDIDDFIIVRMCFGAMLW